MFMSNQSDYYFGGLSQSQNVVNVNADILMAYKELKK